MEKGKNAGYKIHPAKEATISFIKEEWQMRQTQQQRKPVNASSSLDKQSSGHLVHVSRAAFTSELTPCFLIKKKTGWMKI